MPNWNGDQTDDERDIKDKYRRQSLAQAAKILANAKPGEPVKIPNDGMFMFDMNQVYWSKDDPATARAVPANCDTVGCILGLCHLLEVTAGRPNTWLNDRRTLETSYDDPYYKLFYPNLEYSYDRVSPAQAARATKAFLAGDTRPDFGPAELPEPEIY